MKIRWFGHACFLLESKNGTKVVTDPFDGSIGYKIPKVFADIVTVSHDHYDHNYTEGVQGEPKIIDDAAIHILENMTITGIPAFHDDEKGAKRGPIIIYIFEIDGIRICHLSDLGHLLSKSQIEEIGKIDVLLVPVGGTFTLNSEGAVAVIGQLSPKIIIPMHFKTPAVNLPIDPVDEFLEKIGGGKILEQHTLEITPDLLEGDRKIFVLSYE